MIHAEIKALVSAVNIAAAATAGRQTAQKQKRQHKTWHLPTEKRVRDAGSGSRADGQFHFLMPNGRLLNGSKRATI